MRRLGERFPSGGESAAENKKETNSEFAEKIGQGIFGFRQRMEEKRREKSVQKTLAEITSLVEARDNEQGNAKQWNLESIQRGNCDNLSDERVIDAVLDSFTSFNPDHLASLVDRGVPVEKIFGNEKLRRLCASSFEEMLASAESEEHYDKYSSPIGWFTRCWDSEIGEGKIRQAFFESVLQDESIREQIIKNVGTETIGKCGDRILDDLVDDTYHYGGKENEKDTAIIDSRFELIKSLGYDYFREDEKEERVAGLVGEENVRKCSILNKFGYIDGDIVSGMYAARLDLATNYLKHGELPESSAYHSSERSRVEAALYIPWGLEPNEDDEIANYWREQNEKCGFDVLAFATQAIREEAHSDWDTNEEMFTWLDGGKINDAFFDSANRNTPLHDIEGLFYRENVQDEVRDKIARRKNDALIFYSNNAEKIADPNARGLVMNWAKIKGATEEETETARAAYLYYIARGSDRFLSEYDADSGKMKDILLFNEDGTPADNFYDYQSIVHYSPKSFLPFIDENWQEHYGPGELAGFDFLEEFPSFPYSVIFRNVDTEGFAQLLVDEPAACRGLAKLVTKNRMFDTHAVAISPENIADFFDENGPKQAFLDALLESGGEEHLDYLRSMPEEMKKNFTFSPETQRCIELYEKAGWLPEFVYARQEYIDENGKRKRRPWTDTIPIYFGEDGPKQALWQEALEQAELKFLTRQCWEYREQFGFDEEIMDFLDYYKTIDGALPKTLFENETYVDENGETQTRSWTENISTYYNEDGPTTALFRKCLEEYYAPFFKHIDDAELTQSGLDGISIQFISSILKDKTPTEPFSASNIVGALAVFIEKDANDWCGASEDELRIREAFATSEAKDLAMSTMRAEYLRYLNSADGTEFPIGLKTLAGFMRQNDGAGPLVQIEAFLDFMGALEDDDECKHLTAAIENRMDKNHWDNQEKANFYAISAEMLQASPDIYKEFAELFANIKDKGDFETFTKEIYPLYRAKLALLREYDYTGDGVGHGVTSVNYNNVDKEALKNQLHNALLPFNLQELSPDKRREGIEMVRKNILGEITELFRSKLGIRPEGIPDTFTKADIGAIEDMCLYLSNINEPSKEKKDLIGLFLALRLDRSGGWEALRSGGFVDVGKYMGIEAGYTVDECVKKSRENDPVNADNTGISEPERLGEFRSALQEEVSTVRISNLQTIDQRLQNLISNIEDLTDPDLYPDDTDKKKIVILERYSPKSIGSVAAKMWQRTNGRDIAFGEGEEEIAEDLEKLLSDQGIEATPENIKTHLQDGFNSIKIPFTIRQAVEDSHATEAIRDLQKSLMPPEEIAEIFGKLGEEFKPQSGVLAIGADLEFLENLVVKHEDKLDESEKEAVKEYIDGIRDKMGALQAIYEKIAKNFEKYQKSIHGGEESQLRAEIEEVSKIIKGGSAQAAVTTTCTNNMSTIINNMRACLSAKTKGCNNDTDLTFGESYKFYLYSSSGSAEKGSTTDEIVYFVPEEHNGEKSMCFVMDQVYGHKNSEIFAGHVDTIIKKAEALKKQFPEVPIRIFIPETTLSSSSIAGKAEDVKDKIALPAGATIGDVESATFTIPESGFADHYIEFGGMGPRRAGERQASGIEIIL